jgi:hypothetical protein
MGAVQNPRAKQRALMVLREQAAGWVEAYKADVVASGLGFTPADLAAVKASAVAHPVPSRKPGLLTKLSMFRVGFQAGLKSYPADGLPDDDPRLTPVAGLSFPAYAVAAVAIGWADDAALNARVMAALGHPPEAWLAAVDGWTERLTHDVVLATMYGQLFSQVGELPVRVSR